MENTCLNCDYSINENFCTNCGQKRFKRIDKKYVTDELQYLLIHTNKGFLYTIKKLIKNPGKTAREFIDGNRINHYKPLLLTFVLSGISAFITFKIIGLEKVMRNVLSGNHLNSKFMNDYTTITSSYSSIFMLCLVPVFAFVTWLAFHKLKNNYYEHIVMNSYILSLYMIINIVFLYPILYLLRNSNYILYAINLSNLTVPFLLVWFFKGFYPQQPLKQIIWRALAAIGLMMVAFFVLMIIVMIVVFIYAIIKGPEALEYIQPNK